MSTAIASPTTVAATTISKLKRRILPLLFLLYIVAYLDRINIGFAAFTMNQELGISSAQFGFLTGIFFCGYFLFEIPSNLILHNVGARLWIARILVSWGAIAMLGGLVHSASQLYVVRFLLGVAARRFTATAANGVLLPMKCRRTGKVWTQWPRPPGSKAN
jgi:ACS family tartrate transporter-like MFS transporter